MSGVLLDTDIFSFMFKDDTRARPYKRHLIGKDVCISFMSVAELYRWSQIHKWGSQKAELLKLRLNELEVLSPDDFMCQEWARIVSTKGLSNIGGGCLGGSYSY